MKRNVWDFPYPADKLVEAAKAKRDLAQSRIDFWSKKKDETMAAIRERGLTVDESLAIDEKSFGASVALNNFTQYRGPTVSIDDKLLRDLNECVTKLGEHRRKKLDYNGWIEVLGSQGQATFNLNHDDWLFFFSMPKTEAAEDTPELE